MRNKTIVVTKQNFNDVAARVKKFFEGHDVVNWHTYDCGFKGRIPRDFPAKFNENPRKRIINRFCRPYVTIETLGCNSDNPDDVEKYIEVHLDNMHKFVIRLGHEIQFTGNRFMFRRKEPLPHRVYLYETYQRWDPNGGFADVKPFKYYKF